MNYKKGQIPQGNKFSIQLNEMVDIWAGEVREPVVNKPLAVTNPQIYVDKSRVMVRLEEENRWIHGDIERKVEDAITKGPMVEYLMGKNTHWKEKIFHMVD